VSHGREPDQTTGALERDRSPHCAEAPYHNQVHARGDAPELGKTASFLTVALAGYSNAGHVHPANARPVSEVGVRELPSCTHARTPPPRSLEIAGRRLTP